MTKLDPGNVPEEFHRWLSLAERWAIGDDYEREQAVDEVTEPEFAELVAFTDAHSDVAEWLSGPESYSSKPSAEYLAFTHLTMAWDSIRVRFRGRRD